MQKQRTRTDQFLGRPWAKGLHLSEPHLRKVVPRVHYRLVTGEAGYPLSTFKGSRELFEAAHDGFIGKNALTLLVHRSQ